MPGQPEHFTPLILTQVASLLGTKLGLFFPRVCETSIIRGPCGFLVPSPSVTSHSAEPTWAVKFSLRHLQGQLTTHQHHPC